MDIMESKPLNCPSCNAPMAQGYLKVKAHAGPFNMVRGFSIGTSAVLYWVKKRHHFKKSEIFAKYPSNGFICEECKCVLFQYEKISKPKLISRATRSSLEWTMVLLVLAAIILIAAIYNGDIQLNR